MMKSQELSNKSLQTLAIPRAKRTFAKIVLALFVFLFGQMTAMTFADEGGGAVPGVEESLKQLRDKQDWELNQMDRLGEKVLIPAGEFTMGNSEGLDDQQPEHTVYVGKFYMDAYEVTQLQYEFVMEKNPSYLKNCPLCPVEKVTYHQAKSYCEKLGKRLPTEAEWEKAAKGGIEGNFYWNGDNPDEFAWFGNNSDGRPHPVGEKKPNPYGLYDMAGNVWEWVEDWYDADYYKNSRKRNPTGPKDGENRVIRGGGWGYLPELLSHTHRGNHPPGTRHIDGGFRCASDTRIH